MKSIRNNILLVLMTGTILLSSCRKFLDKKSSTGLVVASTIADYQALLDDYTTMNSRRTCSFPETSADDFFLLESRYNSLSTLLKNQYLWTPTSNTVYPGDWAPAYAAIYNTNLSLEGLAGIPVTNDNRTGWNNVKGSAHFYRAYYYQQLVWAYAKAYDNSTADSDMGIVLRNSSNYNDQSVRASVKACYQQVINDAMQAAAFLPDLPGHVMRPSKAAAYGVLARSYLSMRIYDSAFKYANLCLQLKSNLINYNGDTDINGSITGSNPFRPYNKEVIFHSTMTISFQLHIPATGALTDTVLYASYAANDLRKKAFFSPSNGYFRFKGNYAASNTELFSGIATDEMYLVRAETFARKGDKDAALADLNTLLAKRYDATFTALTATDAPAALNIILQERRKELLIRGLRWIDIKRYNKEGTNIVLTHKVGSQSYTLQPNANYYALPIPEDIISLSGIPQNPY